MSSYDQKIAEFEQHAAAANAMIADLRREGEQLVDLYSALRLAFEERMQRAYRPGDEFTEGDEARAEQLLLELYPVSGA